MLQRKHFVHILLGLGITISIIYALKYESWVTFRKAREPIQVLMKDPDAAKFRGEFISFMGWFCGEVNSKNEYGTYVGYKRFFSNTRPTRIFIEGTGRADEVSNSEESVDDYLLRLTKETEILRQENLAQKSGKPHKKYSESERSALANQQIFDELWAERCQRPR